MKKNKCEDCLIGAQYPYMEVYLLYERDIDDISEVFEYEFFNYCPYCRS